MDDYKRLFETVVDIGERHSRLVITQASELRRMRQTIWRALSQLRAGRADLARHTLEQQLRKEQIK